MSLPLRCFAELIGTFWLVFGGCGSAVLAASSSTALSTGHRLRSACRSAFGLTVLTMAYAIGHISGCHLNPAVSDRPLRRRALPASDLVPYIVAQVVGGIAGAAVLYVIAAGKAASPWRRLRRQRLRRPLAGRLLDGGGAGRRGRADVLLPDDYPRRRPTGARPQGFAPIAIGLGLTLIHLIGIPVTNLSVNPARSTGPAVFVGGWALDSSGSSGSRRSRAR